MRISLVTACFNSASVIRTAFESVLAQEGADYEYLVVDGGSKDGTVDLIRAWEPRFNGRMRWISEPDEGLYDAIDKGIRMATGEVVGILNSDDFLDGTDVLARVAASFDSPALDCIYGNVRFVREPGGPTRRVCFARFWRPWMLHWGYMPPHPSVYIRRARFAEWGGYVPSRREYRIAADCELLIRFFCRHRMTHRYVPLCTTVMRLGGLSTAGAGAVAKLNAEVIKANRANGYFCCWPMLLPKYAVKIWEVILPRLGLCRT